MEAEDWMEYGTNESMDQRESSWTTESMEKGGQGTGWNMDKINGAWTTEVAHGPHRWSVNQADEA